VKARMTIVNGKLSSTLMGWVKGLHLPSYGEGLGVGHFSLFTLSFFIFLVACSSEEDVVPEVVELPVEVQGFVSRYSETAPLTRAWTLPTGYELYPIGDDVIAINFTKDGKDPKAGHFFKGSDGWRTNVSIGSDEVATPFYLYGYVPHKTGIDCSVTDLSSSNASFSTGAIMTLRNVPTIMSNDLCVVIGAKNGKDDYEDDPLDYEVVGLRRGDFAYQAAAIETGVGGTGNFVYLLFDHLYAALNIHMRIHGDYAALRTIKLKELQLRAISDDTPTKALTNITVTLAATDGSNPISSIVFTPTGDDVSKVTSFSSKDGEALPLDYEPFTSYFMPRGVTKFEMTSTYDVYDKSSPTPNLVRKDCHATNMLDFSALFDRFEEARTGTRYNVYLTVKPTYLYMLSEPDLNSPAVVVE